MKQLIRKLIGSFFVCIILFVIPGLGFGYNIAPSHPRLYFTADNLQTLRQRITTTHRVQWQALLSWNQPDANAYTTYSGRDIDRTHQYVERNAFMYLMLADSNPALAQQYAQIAKNWMMELAAYDFATSPNDAFEFLWALAIGYDWLYHWPGFTEAEKQQVRNQLIERTDIHINKTGLQGFPSFPTGPATSKGIYDNMSTENNMANAFVGLALWEADNRYGTNASAQKYMDACYFRLKEAYKATNTYCSNGGYWEGQGYYGARFQGEVYFAYVWKVATGEDLFASNNHIRNSVYYWIYGLRPDGASSREGDQTCVPSGCDRNRFIAEILADYYQDGYFQWYAHYQGALTGGDWPDLVLYNANLQAQDPSTLPLYRNFQFGHIVIRTGWDIGPGSEDTYFTFHIHDWVSGHTHVDSNSFTLFRKGALAIDSGRYNGNTTDHSHERDYAIRTIAHNSITVYKPGEDFGSFSNDGGQEFLFKESNADDPSYISDLYDGTRFDTSTLELFEAGPGYYYMKGNATDAYHSTGYHAPSDGAEAKISNFTREVAFFPKVPYPALIVFDRISSLNENWPKQWLLHSIHEPDVNGDITQVEVPNHIVNYGGDLVTVSRNEGKLFSKTLLPSSINIRKVGGTGYEFWVDDPGQNYPLDPRLASDVEAGAWRVEIEPTLPVKDDTFLHVLYLTDASVSSMPPALLIDVDGMYGVEMDDQVTLFSKTGNPIITVAYPVSGASGTVTHLLTGLLPGTYYVTQNGAPIAGSPFTTGNQSSLLFESSGGGNFLVSNSSPGQVSPDFVETGVSNPPATAKPGSTFSLTDTVKNQGNWAASISSVTRYYFSADTVRDSTDILLTGNRSVPALAIGAISSGAVTVIIPSAIPFGSYYLLACADDTNAVAETDENNNCIASSTAVQVSLPDYVETSVTNPPATIILGGTFQVTDTAKNQGIVASTKTSSTRYYLSLDTVKGSGDKLLTGTRSVPALGAGVSHIGTVTVTVPTTTALELYYLLACADDANAVAETVETNNCKPSGTAVQVSLPDYVETSVSNPPATIILGGNFSITDTVNNQGIVASTKTSSVRYYLSLDTTKGTGDKLLSGTRSVPILAAGATSSGTINVTVPTTTTLGTYYLLACADDTMVVTETNENNNCKASSTKVQVTQ